MFESDPNAEAKMPYRLLKIGAIAVATKAIATGMDMALDRRSHRLGIALAAAGTVTGLSVYLHSDSQIQRFDNADIWKDTKS